MTDVMNQHWGSLLFIHWPMDAHLLRERLPRGVDVDLYDGRAWVGVIPFTMWGVRASFLPPVPGLSAFHELNVRTYVRVGGVPGVWFFSLDASNPVAVYAARLTYHLPYFSADMDLEREGETIRYRSMRTHRNAPPARFEASWRPREPLGESRPGSIEHFLTERYCLYAEHRGKLFRGRIHHDPWPLRRAVLESIDSTMLKALDLPTPAEDPLLHHADHMAVAIWPLESVERSARRALAEEARPEPVAAPQ